MRGIKYVFIGVVMVSLFSVVFIVSRPFLFHTFLQLLPTGQLPQVQAEALHAQLQTDTAWVLLDTRSREEYAVSHLPHAIWVGDEVSFNANSIIHLPKDTPLLLYCSIGYRSSRIGKLMTDMGYTHIQNLYGGIFAWTNAGYPLSNKHGPTNHIHPFSSAWGGMACQRP